MRKTLIIGGVFHSVIRTDRIWLWQTILYRAVVTLCNTVVNQLMSVGVEANTTLLYCHFCHQRVVKVLLEMITATDVWFQDTGRLTSGIEWTEFHRQLSVQLETNSSKGQGSICRRDWMENCNPSIPGGRSLQSTHAGDGSWCDSCWRPCLTWWRRAHCVFGVSELCLKWVDLWCVEWDVNWLTHLLEEINHSQSLLYSSLVLL